MIPNRLARNVKNHLLSSLLLLIILFATLMLFQTLASVLFRGNIVLTVIASVLLLGFYYALPEKIRLDRDGELMRVWRNEHPDGKFNAYNDAYEVFHSAEFKTDVISLLATAAALAVIIVAAIYLRLISPQILETVSPAVFLLLIPAGALVSIPYACFHLFFTVRTHSDWEATRIHLSQERHM